MRLLFTMDKQDYDPSGRAFVRPSVRGIIWQDGKVAMVHSLKYDYYKFPGGGMEPGENQVDTLIRETLEESGLAVIPESIREFGYVHRVQKDDCSEAYEYFVQDNYYYLCQAQPETQRQVLDDYEAEEGFTLEFVTPEKAIRTNRFQPHGPKDLAMLEREARVLEVLVQEMGEREACVSTLNWYRENCGDFSARTWETDMSQLYDTFLTYVKSGGKIMDLGCGAGNASAYFAQRGFAVLPIDGCKELCEETTKRTGFQARNILFEELDYEEEFDGIWACASLLHVPKTGMAKVLHLVRNALKEGGVFYASYKYGETQRLRNGRLFSDYTEDAMGSLLSEVGGLEIVALWATGDARPDRVGERWLNVICKRELEA